MGQETKEAITFIRACREMNTGAVVLKTKKISLQFDFKLDKLEDIGILEKDSNKNEENDMDLQNLLNPHEFIQSLEENKVKEFKD